MNSFGLAIEAADTYDKTNVWYSMNGLIDMAASSSPSGKEIGKESGRNEVGIDVVLYYSGLQQVTEESLMGTVTIEIEFDNYKDGDANHKGTLNIVVEVYRLGSGENYYVDGVNGKDETGYGHDPDKAAATVNYIFNRCNYRPGGNTASSWMACMQRPQRPTITRRKTSILLSRVVTSTASRWPR